MLKQCLIFLFLSILIVALAPYFHHLAVYIAMLIIYVNYHLAPFFDSTGWELILRKVLILLALPVIFVGIPALIYKQIKKHNMPHFFPMIWVLWTVMVLSNILIR